MSYLFPPDRRQRQPDFHHVLSTQPTILFQKVRRKLEDAATTQEKLAESREELLKEHERLRASGGRVRNKRIEAGNAEAAFMSALRDYLNHINVDIPKPLLEAYGQVETFRNELGVLEEDFLEADRKHAGIEWRLLDQENDFFQFDLLEIYDSTVEEYVNETQDAMDQIDAESTIGPSISSPALPLFEQPLSPSTIPEDSSLPPPSHSSPQYMATSSGTQDGYQRAGLVQPPRLTIQPAPPDLLSPLVSEDAQYRNVRAELEGLKKHFDILREVQSDQLDVTDDDYTVMRTGLSLEEPDLEEIPTVSEFQSTYFGVLQQISDHEVAAQRLKTDIMLRETRSLAISRRCSDPTHVASTAPLPSIFMGKALTETAVPLFSNDPKTEDRVREWLLNYLKENAVQEALYRNILASNGVESPVDESWEDRATRFWDKDNAGNIEASTRVISHASQEPEEDGSPIEIGQFTDQQSELDQCDPTVHPIEYEVCGEPTSLQCRSPDPLVPLSSAGSKENLQEQIPNEYPALAEQLEVPLSSSDTNGHDKILDVESPVPNEVIGHEEGDPATGPTQSNGHDAETIQLESVVEEVDTSPPQAQFTLPSTIDTAQDEKDIQTTLDTQIPTIVTTSVDMPLRNTGMETAAETDEPRVQQTNPPNEQDSQALESSSCAGSCSQLMVLRVSTRPKSDYGGEEKSHLERLSNTWSRIRHHRRAISASNLPEYRVTSYDLGRKRKC